MTYKKKLIEVALPLDAINKASAREKSIRHGHPSTLHLWWARRPLAAARAVLWSSLVDDPSSHPEKFPTEEDQELERQRLFRILEELVIWENSTNEQVLSAARAEITASCDGNLPNVLDPFCGGGTIPLEAQRLGLPAYGGDLNPVAVLISKAMVEIPPRFADVPPVNLEARASAGLRTWERAEGLAEDIRYYGQWMSDRAFERIGHLYPKVELSADQGGGEATVIAALWARTVTCPNPACQRTTPMLTSFVLSSKKGKEKYLVPHLAGSSIHFEVAESPPSRWSEPKKGLKRGTSGIFECLHCGSVTERNYVAAEGEAGRIGTVPTVLVVDGGRSGRQYLEVEADVQDAAPNVEGLEVELPRHPRDVWCHNFGLHTIADLFSNRQLTALNTFSDLLSEVRPLAEEHAVEAGLSNDGTPLRDGGSGATAYADAVITYLAFVVDKSADYWSTICSWHSSGEKIRNTFGRQAIPMTWDFAETNPFSSSTGNWMAMVNWVWKVIDRLPASGDGEVLQRDAMARVEEVPSPVLSTDPPYYDNISYADLSDFFYAWMRRNLKDVWPDELSTMLTPKAEELIANRYRAGSAEAAKIHFESGMESVFGEIAERQNPDYPATVFYAFKQAVTTEEGTASTGWETFIQGVLASGFAITATWPMRTELGNRMIAKGTAALASSIVLACRPRPTEASRATRSEYIAALREELPDSLRMLQRESIAPVDMAQSMIGPGMAVFSRYSKVLEADGSDMSVRQALALINQVLEEVLSSEETEFDNETRWALTWYEQHGLNPAAFGDADVLARAKDTSAEYVQQAGVASVSSGKVRLLARTDLDPDWDPKTDRILTVWEITQHLIVRLAQSELQAAGLLRQVGGGDGERARQLAYLLYQIADRRGWSEEAVAYNGLVQAWSEISKMAARQTGAEQQTLGG